VFNCKIVLACLGHYGTALEHNREIFGALLKSIIGNFKSIMGSGLVGINFIFMTQDMQVDWI